MQYHYRWPENCWSLARKATHRAACKLLGTLQLCTALWVLIMSWRLYFLVLRRIPQGQRKPEYILQCLAQNTESTTKLFDCCWILFLFLDVRSNDFYSLEWEEGLLLVCIFCCFFFFWMICLAWYCMEFRNDYENFIILFSCTNNVKLFLSKIST